MRVRLTRWEKRQKRLVGKKASAFLVTDKGVEKAGLADKVKVPLEKEGFKVEVFVGVAGTDTHG
ncbi:MAG: hypothetical protein GWN64_12890 [Candidatus Thorarchaeota archaeon]|nr:hypothetical protein [Candidatus Thorarchaeota archaeon]